MSDTWPRWSAVVVFATAMAWVEAAVVLYLRTLVDRIVPYQTDPLPPLPGADWAELVREASTLLMLGAVGWLAGRSWRSRLGYFALAFGWWDILYYVFLIPLTGWPRSWRDWDVLFLLPLPWWGPVLAPILIALVLVCGGTLVVRHDTPDRPFWPRATTMACGGTGAVLALYVFMADALRTAHEGEAALRAMLPQRFNWSLFLLALGLMILPVADLCLRTAARSSRVRLSAPPGRTREVALAKEA